MSNVWDEVPDWGGVGALRLDRPSSCALGASVWELQPQGANWYHLHHGSEEMIVVLCGTPRLRTPEGERMLAEGDVVVFPRGREGDRERVGHDCARTHRVHECRPGRDGVPGHRQGRSRRRRRVARAPSRGRRRPRRARVAVGLPFRRAPLPRHYVVAQEQMMRRD
jgi:hypothetical protein